MRRTRPRRRETRRLIHAATAVLRKRLKLTHATDAGVIRRPEPPPPGVRVPFRLGLASLGRSYLT